MDGDQEWMSAEQMTPKQILAEGWRLTRAILALKGMEIPDTIHFQINRANQIRATRVATLEDLGKAIAALDEAIEHRSQDVSSIKGLHRQIETEELNKERDALAELRKRAGRGGDPPSTTVIEALFPDLPVRKKTPAEKAEIEEWLAIRKEEGRKINPETAEVDWIYADPSDPYGVLDEWELPEEWQCVGREYFARSPGSEIWVEFGDLPDETRDKLWKRHGHKLAFPAGLEDLSDIGRSDVDPAVRGTPRQGLSRLKEHPRWCAIVGYRTRNGLVDVDHLFEELHELHDLIERGPDWETIESITINLNPRRQASATP
jgi:hypothetical protein